MSNFYCPNHRGSPQWILDQYPVLCADCNRLGDRVELLVEVKIIPTGAQGIFWDNKLFVSQRAVGKNG